MNKLTIFLRKIYEKIFIIDDSPQKIALGFGIGVFLGILPGTGPLAAIVIAGILRLNKASALAGAILFNTWINIVAAAFAIKIGSVIIGIKPFEKIILPLVIGYLIIAVFLGLAAYLCAITLLSLKKKRN